MLVKDDSFINIQGWMVTRLGLKGIELLVYACIHGFSHDDGTVFRGSRQYLAEFCGTSLSSIARSLRSLKDRGLIVQVHHSVDNSEVFYKAITEPSVSVTRGVVSDWHDPSVKLTRGVVSKVTEASVKMTRAIKDDNIVNKLENKLVDNIVVCETTRTRFQKPTIEEVKEYAKRNGTIVSDPERFFEYYSANGWKVGRNPMKDWKAAFRMWESKDKKTVEADKGFQRDQYGVKYMVNDYPTKNKDSNDLLDQLLEDE